MVKLMYYAAIFLLAACVPRDQKNPPTPTPSTESQWRPHFAQADRRAKLLAQVSVLDTLMAQYQRQHHLPSVAYALVMDDTLIYHRGIGRTQLPQGPPPDEHTPYRIASMTKSLTALAILKLREMGLLDLHQPAENYLPALAGLIYPTPDAPRITVHHLLTMTAGFPEDNPWGDRQLDDTDAELADLIKAGLSFSTPPGTEFEYSNLGYALLGQIIQRVSGQSYRDFMQTQIFAPLDMRESYWDYDGPLVQPLAQGYRWEEDQWKEEPLLKDGAYACMGGLISTLTDWSKYMAFLLRAWSTDTLTSPVSRAALRMMQTPWAYRGVGQRLDPAGKPCAESSFYGYGLGWRRTCRGWTYVSHGGGLPGYGSTHLFIPELGLGVVAFSNRTYAGVGSPAIKALDSMIFLAQLEARTLEPSAPLKQAQAQLITLLPELPDEPTDTLFAENFYLDEHKTLRRKHLQAIFSQAGPIQSNGELKPLNNLRGTFSLQAEKGVIEVFFTMTPESPPKIQALEVKFIPHK